MTVSEMTKYLGKSGWLAISDLKVPVNVVDLRHVFGATQARVTPVNGTGIVWVDLARITFQED